MKIKQTRGDAAFSVIVYILCTLMVVVAVYPFIYSFSMSVSDPMAVTRGGVVLWPVGFQLEAYTRIMQNTEFWLSLLNSLWVTVIGTSLMVICTVMAAYVLSRPNFFARRFFNLFFAFTLFFWAGLVPFFMVVNMTGLYNSRWALVIPYLIETWNFVICRTYFQQLPGEVFESARIDGCGEFRLLTRIALPLSKQIVAVMALFYAISNWNGYFAAQLFIPDVSKQPLQNFLKRMLIDPLTSDLASMSAGGALSAVQSKYAIVIIASIPMIILYPFVQRYFEKGVMIGSVKG